MRVRVLPPNKRVMSGKFADVYCAFDHDYQGDQSKIDLKDLLGDATNQIKDDGGKIGAFVITNLGTQYETALKNFIAKSPNCLDNQQLPTLEMEDGSLRTTFATTNFEPLDCLKVDMNVIMDTFEKVDRVVYEMIKSQASLQRLKEI